MGGPANSAIDKRLQNPTSSGIPFKLFYRRLPPRRQGIFKHEKMSIKTKGCNLLIDNVTELFGTFDIESSSLRDFVQPASFDEQYAILPLGLNTPIVWMYYKETRTAAEYKFERENDQVAQYKIDLIIPEQKEAIANVMRKTDRVLWRCTETANRTQLRLQLNPSGIRSCLSIRSRTLV
jgi:hypothetical protein